MSTVRCCLACGRWGTHAFRPADNGADGSVCTNDRACRRRAARTTACQIRGDE